MNNPQFQSASVKVMRSHDYCHFEVCLSSTATTPEEVDGLRKTAARLADKAVEQYKVAKENANRVNSDTYAVNGLRYRVEEIKNKAEADRTPRDKAILKKADDFAHYSRPRYDYQDDWREDDHLDTEVEGDDEVTF